AHPRPIRVPVKLLLLRDWPYSNSGILDRTHLRFFTRKSLHRALTQTGYEIVALDGIRSVIRTGVPGYPKSSPLNLCLRAVAAMVVLLSLGLYHDTQYPQYGFRVRA